MERRILVVKDDAIAPILYEYVSVRSLEVNVGLKPGYDCVVPESGEVLLLMEEIETENPSGFNAYLALYGDKMYCFYLSPELMKQCFSGF